MFKEGDEVEGVGVVEFNHCGMPWVAGLNGMYYGVIQVRDKNNNSYMCDAITGVALSKAEMDDRLNNMNFDYDGKCDNRKEWSKKNQPYGPFYYRYRNSALKSWYYRLCHWLRGQCKS